MTVQEVRDSLNTYTNERRVAPLRALMPKLSGVSHASLRQFQAMWDTERPFEEFRKAQDAEIGKCVDLELSPAGVAVREALGLEPLLPETVLEVMP